MKEQEILIKMALDAWNTHVKRADNLLSELSDEQLQQQVSPGKNTGIYLLGHLTAVHDGIFVILGISKQMYPQLNDVFLSEPDNSGHAFPAAAELRKSWNTVNTALTDQLKHFTTQDWFSGHTSVSAQEFAKEPHRNKLNIIINRTNHLAWHTGQLVLLKK
jgi:hypothetical protein